MTSMAGAETCFNSALSVGICSRNKEETQRTMKTRRRMISRRRNDRMLTSKIK